MSAWVSGRSLLRIDKGWSRHHQVKRATAAVDANEEIVVFGQCLGLGGAIHVSFYGLVDRTWGGLLCAKFTSKVASKYSLGVKIGYQLIGTFIDLLHLVQQRVVGLVFVVNDPFIGIRVGRVRCHSLGIVIHVFEPVPSHAVL